MRTVVLCLLFMVMGCWEARAQPVALSESSVVQFLGSFDTARCTLEQVEGLPAYFSGGATFVTDLLGSDGKWKIDCATPRRHIDDVREFVSKVQSSSIVRKEVKISVSEGGKMAAVESKVSCKAVTKDGKTSYEIPTLERLVIVMEEGKPKIQSLWLSAVSQ